jgi:hypothetical protein
MAKTISLTEHLHFLAEMKAVLGDRYEQTRRVWKQLSEAALSRRGTWRPGLGPSGCALHGPGEKAFRRAGSRAFSGGVQVASQHLAGLIRRTGRLAWGRLG